LESGRVYFKNFATGLKVLDPYTKELRNSTKKDLGDIARFCDALPEVDFFTLAVAAQDVDPRVKDLHELEATLSNTSKHFSHDAQNLKNARKIIDMAACACGGREALRKRPIISMGTCTISPLELTEECTDMIIEAAKCGIPMNVLAMGLAGGTTPVTMAGTLVVTNAEVLGGIVLSQLVSKGAPMMYGTSNTIMDLRYTTSPVGAPEHAMCCAAVGQLGQFYDIPTDVGGT
jgi:trimethylamine--corrinoid protein Co-methyltransferase